MGFGSPSHWLILLLIAVVFLGGKGKISSIMGDVADGIKSFKKGMADDSIEVKKAEDQKVLDAQRANQAAPTQSSTKA